MILFFVFDKTQNASFMNATSWWAYWLWFIDSWYKDTREKVHLANKAIGDSYFERAHQNGWHKKQMLLDFGFDFLLYLCVLFPLSYLSAIFFETVGELCSIVL